jgi:Fungal Zn(2)-Cys(6) binuclear cluster domain
VETLLDQDSCPGASVEELELFKSQFRTSAYTCRLRSCPRATIGFDSDQLRHEHEVAHAGGFRCAFLGCQYPPFRSSKALTAHVNLNHCHLTTLPRKSIRRVGRLELSERFTSIRGTRKDGDDSTKPSGRGKGPSSTENQPDPSTIQWPDSAHSNKKRSRSPPSSPRKSPKSKRSRPACLECSTKNIRCNKARPTCAICKRWSRVCIYPDSCEQCVSKGLKCEKSQPICKACKSSSIRCSYDDSAENDCDNGDPATVAVGSTIDPEELTSNSKRKFPIPQGGLKESSTGETQPFGSSGIGVGYLDILLNEFAGGASIDPGLFERIKATFTNDIHACWKLSEVVDKLTAGSVDALAPDKIISHLWSGHPELARELKRLHEPLQYCFCNKESSGTMIACDNPACPCEWFHLHCVNLVVTPDQDEKWFCSDNCRKAGGTVTVVEQDGADHGV